MRTEKRTAGKKREVRHRRRAMHKVLKEFAKQFNGEKHNEDIELRLK